MLKKSTVFMIIITVFICLLAYITIFFSNHFQDEKNTPSLRLALDWIPNTNYTGIYIAKDFKWYENINIIEASITPSLMLLAAGETDVSISFLNDIIYAREKGMPVVIIGALVQDNPSCLAWLDTKKIRSIKDLEGKTYAGWGSKEEQFFIKYLIKKEGLASDSITLISTGTRNFLDIVPSTADFMWIFMSWTGQKLLKEKINFGSYCPEYPGVKHPAPLLVTNETILKNSPNKIKDFLAATSKGYQWAVQHPNDAVEVISKYIDPANKDFIASSVHYLQTRFIGHAKKWGIVEKEEIDAYISWLEDEKLIKRNKNLEFDTLVNLSLLPD